MDLGEGRQIMRTCFIYSSTWTPGFHIGAARVMLMNWAAAAKTDGKLVLICDDFAKPFSNANTGIYDLTAWLGGDLPCGLSVEGPYYNVHSRYDYNLAVERLLGEGWAYHDYAMPQEIHQERQTCSPGKPFIYSRKWAAFSKEDCERFEAEGRKAVIRLKMPRTTEETLRIEEQVAEDALHGCTRYEFSQEHDYVIRQTDGGYTSFLTLPINYNLRKIDFIYADWRHRQSLPAQLFIARRLGFRLPKMAHIPFLTEPNGRRRFSDRRHAHHFKEKSFANLCQHGQRIDSEIAHILNYGPFSPCYVDFYRRIGFLPAALRHYLLGTVMKDGTPLTLPAPFSHAEHLLKMCNFTDIKHTPTAFNPIFVWTTQQRYMVNCDMTTKCWMINDFLRAVKLSDYWQYDFKDRKPPQDLQSFVENMSSKLVCAGDVITLVDHFDEALAVRGMSDCN